MSKKLFAVFAAAMLVFTMFGVSVFADEPGSVSMVQTSYADKDGDFTVEVRLTYNPGLKSMSVNVRYDYQVVKLKSVSDAGLLGGYFSTQNGNIVQLTWTGNGKDTDVTGTLATLTFTALDAPTEGSIMYASVSANDARGIAVTVNGNTSIVNFGAGRMPQGLPEDITTEAVTTEEEITEELEETEYFEEEVTTAPPETEAPTTTEPPTTTEEPTTAATTTRRRHTTTTEEETEPPTTTPEPTTEAPTTTTEPTTSAPSTLTTTETTELTTTSDLLILGVTSEDEEEEFADAYTDDIDNKSANRGTMLLAVIAIALTGVVVVAIEMYRRRG